MNKKAGFDFANYIIGLLLVMGILVTFSSFYMGSARKYGISQSSLDATSNFNATYNQINQITELTRTADAQLQGSKTSDESSATTFYGDMLSLGKTIYRTISLPFTLINNMSTALGVPLLWAGIAISILIIIMIAGFIYLIFGKA